MITFDTTQYEASHGHPPRGRGSWAFEIPGVGTWWAPGSTGYVHARAAARSRTRQMLVDGNLDGADVTVEVLP